MSNKTTKMDNTDKINKYFASIYLAMIGDKIGFGDGNREMNYMKEMISMDQYNVKNIITGLTNLMLFKFISEGGVTAIDINALSISDDTIMHFGTIIGLLTEYSNRNKLYDTITNIYLDEFKDIPKMRDELLAGRQTIEAIKSINNGANWRTLPYNKNAGGNGGAMRSMCIGIAFSSPNHLLKLIESSIMICSITHPNCTAFIGSIVSALFVSFGIRGLNIETWIFDLISLLESETIDNVIDKIKPQYSEQFKEDKKAFLHKIMTYVETSFENYNYIIDSSSQRSIYHNIRMEYYFENFSNNKKVFFPGAGADDVIIIAYDCLLMSKNNFEKLIFMAMVNVGDTDTIGTIAAAWYGALYGFDNVPHNLLLDKEHERCKLFAEKLSEKYNDKNIDFF
jgi:ADP-ribosylarginine hydrolase